MFRIHPFAASKRIILYLLLITISLLTGNCKKEKSPGGDKNDPVVDPLKPVAEVTTTVKGVVVDESGEPLSGVSISVHNESTFTSDLGFFELDGIQVPGNRCVVLSEKDGYFEASRAETPVKDRVTEMRLVMMRKTVTQIINGGSGGKASLTNGSEVAIAAGSLVDESGKIYTGSVNMSVRYLDPSRPEFGMLVPGGDMIARRTDQRTSILYSYGILRVKLSGTDGEDLQVAPGKTASIVMDIPDKQLATAPVTIPLWYFDEEKAIWIEEGVATKQGDKYIGTVKHFTDWNCDVPEEAATIIGKLVDCKSDPAWGHVEFGQVGEDVGASADTDSHDGKFSQRVPANTPLTVVVYDPLYLAPLLPGEQGKGKLIVLVPALSPGQVYDVGTLQIFPCPSTIKANFKLKAGDEIDYLLFETAAGGLRYADNPGKTFSMNGFAANSSLTMTVKTRSGMTSFKTIQTPAAGGTVDLGEIDLSNIQEAYIVGRLVCGAMPITSGQVTATWTSAGGSRNEYGSPGSDGTFRIPVALNNTISVSLSTEKGVTNKTVTTSNAAGSVVDLGTVDFCGGPQPGENSFTITGDGYNNVNKKLNLRSYPQSASIFSSSESMTYLSAFDMSDTLRFSVFFSGKAVGKAAADDKLGVFIQVKTGSKTINYMAGFELEGTSLEINVTRYDAVGGLVEGTFKGTLIGDNGNKITISNGKFSVIRYPDI